jgi:hypothetical protein
MIMEEYKCLCCGYIGFPKLVRELYGEDTDGNRGMYIDFLTCRNCGDEDITDEFEDNLEDW